MSGLIRNTQVAIVCQHIKISVPAQAVKFMTIEIQIHIRNLFYGSASDCTHLCVPGKSTGLTF